ncbi:MAG: ComEC/Rec2 family competence protein, partial [Wenzhouxiangella sp.]
MHPHGGWRTLLLFAAGCIVAALVPSLPGWKWIIALAAGSLLLLRPRRTRPAALFALGAVWFLAQAQWLLDRQWPEALAGEELAVRGTVTGMPEYRDQRLRFVLAPQGTEDGRSLPKRIRVDWYRPREYLRPGETWRMPLRLEPPHGRDNPGGFDFHRYLLAGRFGAVATVAGTPRRLAPSGHAGMVDRTRQRLAEILQAETTNREAAALKRALGIADRSAMPPELSERLRRTGTAHLLAISGLHVGMVAGLAAVLGGLLLGPLTLVFNGLDRRRLALVAGALAALGYAALAGFTLPTQRALVMLAAAVVAYLARRRIAPAHTVLLALVAVLLFDPLSVLATGFWLSFAAVAVLIWAFAWRTSEGKSAGVTGWAGGLLRAQVVIAAGLLPLNVGLFSQFVPGALAANLVAIPMVGLWILPALLAEMSGVMIGWPTGWIGDVGEQGLVALGGFLGWIDGLELSRQAVSGGGLATMILALGGAFWLLAPVGWPARWLGLPLMLPLLLPVPDRPDPGSLQARVLDVGDGLAVVIDTDGRTLLYDTGPGDGAGRDVIGRILDPVLARSGSSGIDRVIVSHAHRGHAGGLGSIRDRVPPDRFLASPALGQGEPCHRGQQWQWGEYRFRILHPGRELPDLGANSSCVLHVAGPGGSLLLAGGIDSAVKERLIRDDPDLRADVVVLSAGGHRRAASQAFFEQVSP